MSDIMLQGVLRMPPTLWTGDAWDVAQRHSRYLQAADRIAELEDCLSDMLRTNEPANREGDEVCKRAAQLLGRL